MGNRRRGSFAVVCLWLILGWSAAPLSAGEYPEQAIEIIAPFGAGSSTDRMTLAIIPFMEKELKQKVLPSYRSGGGGTIGTAWLAKAKPDGYNLAIVPTGVVIVKPLTSKLPYALGDFVPISQVGLYQSVLVVKEDSPWKTMKDFLEDAKRNPGKLTFGTSGPFSMGHVAMEAVKQAVGIQIRHVPFEGAGKVMLALYGSQVGMVVTEIRPEFGKDGKTRLLGLVSERRLPEHPDTPTFKELGYDLVMDVSYWLVAPKATPQPIIDKLEGVLKKAAASAEFREAFLKTTGAPMAFLPGKEVYQKWEKDLAVITKVVKELNIEKK
jgi:tripartite-type tricarboxylate transporter receptor subunit TctC